jgi:hypothetical protein
MKDTAPFSEAATSATDSVSPSWTRKFALIEGAGGPKLPDLKKLKTGERVAVIFNIWGFLFGPIYYLVKGMWKKAITLTVFGLGIIFVAIAALTMAGIDAERSLRFIIPTLFAIRANIDYYKKVVLKDNGWW